MGVVMITRIFGGLVLAVALSGCFGGTGGGILPGAGASTAAQTQVLNGALTLAAPRGYCPDPSMSREAEARAFVLFASCRGLTGRGPKLSPPAILTASATPAPGFGADGLDQMARYLASDEGAAALARKDGKGAKITAREKVGDVLLLAASDQGPDGMTPDYARAIFAQSGALVSVTVSPLAKAPMEATAARALALEFVAAIREANPGQTAEVKSETTEQETADPAPKGLKSLLQRLR